MVPLTASRSHRRSLLLTVVILVLVALAAHAPIAAAQDTPQITFRILVLTCDSDPGNFPEGEIPAGCQPLNGVAFSIAVTGGSTLDCTSNAAGRCQVEVPSESSVTVTQDASTIPSGYTPRANPIETEARTEFAGAVFVNLPNTPEPTATKPPASGLPATGSGSPSGGTPWLVISALVILAGVSTAMGRRLHR